MCGMRWWVDAIVWLGIVGYAPMHPSLCDGISSQGMVELVQKFDKSKSPGSNFWILDFDVPSGLGMDLDFEGILGAGASKGGGRGGSMAWEAAVSQTEAAQVARPTLALACPSSFSAPAANDPHWG